MIRRLLAWLGRGLRPLLRPDWLEERQSLERLHALSTEHAAQQAAAAARDAVLAARLARLDELAPAKAVDVVGRHVREMRHSVSAHLRVTSRALKTAGLLDEHGLVQQALQARVARAVARGAALAGPWTGEVGFELLYWIPFLRRLKARLGDATLHAVTRGGSGAWYGEIAESTVDAFDLVDVETFRRETSGETRKQRRVSAFDRRLLRDGRARLGGARGSLVHPALLYEALYPYWKDQLPARLALELLEFARLPPPTGVVLPELPRPYVAARFYFSAAFPETPSNRAWVTRTLRNLTERGHVVLLGTPFRPDDHHDAVFDGPGITSVSSAMTPANNLAVQSAVIAGASGFVGTYGGFSYLAPFYDVPSVACYSHATFFPHHLDIARRAFDQLGVHGLTVVNAGEQELVKAALGGR